MLATNREFGLLNHLGISQSLISKILNFSFSLVFYEIAQVYELNMFVESDFTIIIKKQMHISYKTKYIYFFNVFNYSFQPNSLLQK